MKGNRQGTLHTLNASPEANYSVLFRDVNRQVWHHCLGHCQVATVNALHSGGLTRLAGLNNFPVCENCQINKLHKLPFVEHMDSTYTIMDKVHCDLWGLAPTLSVDKFSYYAILVDENQQVYTVCSLTKENGYFFITSRALYVMLNEN